MDFSLNQWLIKQVGEGCAQLKIIFHCKNYIANGFIDMDNVLAITNMSTDEEIIV